MTAGGRRIGSTPRLERRRGPGRPMREVDVLALASRVSNVGRWGADDQRGTLNLVTETKRQAALRLIETGRMVALGLPIIAGPRTVDAAASEATMDVRLEGSAAVDELTLRPHGFGMTHLDAVCHNFLDGIAWNGRTTESVYSPAGLRFGGVEMASGGIITRGVLLDVAAARGLPHLARGDGISVADLEQAEAHGPVRVEAGDAIFIRSGMPRDGIDDSAGCRTGVLAEVIPWLRDRDVAVYSGDCIERMPSGYVGVPMPLHQIGMTAMGLWFLDNPDVERLASACALKDGQRSR